MKKEKNFQPITIDDKTKIILTLNKNSILTILDCPICGEENSTNLIMYLNTDTNKKFAACNNDYCLHTFDYDSSVNEIIKRKKEEILKEINK